MEQRRFSWKERGNSFTYAWDGIKAVFRTEHNTWIHMALTVAALVLGWVLHVSRGEWIALLIVMTMVWVAEIFNTAIEKTMDFISTQKHPQIKLVKDLAAAAVLLAALCALVTGAIIFIPKIF